MEFNIGDRVRFDPRYKLHVNYRDDVLIVIGINAQTGKVRLLASKDPIDITDAHAFEITKVESVNESILLSVIERLLRDRSG